MTGPEVEVDSDLKGSEDEVLGDVLHRGQPGDVAAAASERAATPAPAGESLPFTGADILAFVGVAAGLMLGGMLLLRLRRSQS